MGRVAKLHVSDPSHLGLIDWLIHDQFFAWDDVGFDEGQGLFTIPFEFEDLAREEIVERTWLRRKKLARVPLLRSFLRVRKVSRSFVNDAQQVGIYDFNQLSFDRASMCLQVETNIPLTIALTVEAIDVEVELTDQVIGFRAIRYVPGGADLRRSKVEPS